MPKFIGTNYEAKIVQKYDVLDDEPYIRLTASQVKMLLQKYKPSIIGLVKELDTTDKGGKHSYAKRWWRYYIPATTILCISGTKNMKERAYNALRVCSIL